MTSASSSMCLYLYLKQKLCKCFYKIIVLSRDNIQHYIYPCWANFSTWSSKYLYSSASETLSEKFLMTFAKLEYKNLKFENFALKALSWWSNLQHKRGQNTSAVSGILYNVSEKSQKCQITALECIVCQTISFKRVNGLTLDTFSIVLYIWICFGVSFCIWTL